jgi:hypothetical protein
LEAIGMQRTSLSFLAFKFKGEPWLCSSGHFPKTNVTPYEMIQGWKYKSN